jgi:hypothetical protein
VSGAKGTAPDSLRQAVLRADLQFRAGALHAQFSPQLHLGPQVQGWQAHCFFSHGLVIGWFLCCPTIGRLNI